MTNHILLSETVPPVESLPLKGRRCYVSNPYPRYEHKPGAKSPPRIILAMRKAARENRPSQHVLWCAQYRYHPLTQKPLMEKRSMNLHRKRAIDAIAECIAANVNIVTCKVHMSLAQMSDACGLTTYNAQGVSNYSRASRAITQHLEAIGAVKCERVWDKKTRSYIPNIIWVQPLFFTLIGYEYGKFESARKQQLAWENLKLKEKNEAPISMEEARKRAREKHIEIALAIRAKERAIKKEKKEKRKRLREISLMSEPEAKYHIQKSLVSQYDKEQLVEIGWVELKNRINKTYHLLKKQADMEAHPPPSG